jgi:DNA mismatch repair ATPase MutS
MDPKTVSTSEMLATMDTEIFLNKDILATIVQDVHIKKDDLANIGADVYNDIEFFKCFTDRNTSTVFDKISSCVLEGSNDILKKLLSFPTFNTNILEQRQHVLQVLDDKAIRTLSFDTLKPHEKDVLWIYEEVDQNLKDIYEMVFFKFCLFKPLNKYPQALTVHNIYRMVCSPMIGLLSPIIYFIIPYLIIVYRFKLRISFKAYISILLESMMSDDFFMGSSGNYKYFKVISYALSIIFYFQGILNSFEISKTIRKVSQHIVQKVNNVVTFLKLGMDHIKRYWDDAIVEAFLDKEKEKVSTLRDIKTEEEYVGKLEVLEFSLYKNFGKQLHTYMTFDKDIIKSILLKVYIIESLKSVSTFKNDFGLSFAKFDITSSTPVLAINGVFHPCIDIQKVVKNNVCFNGNDNAIVTGPNAGGKSTFVKSLLINVLLCQTIGIASAVECTLTPFYNINSQINIPDSKGYESLFEAEMYRCKEKLDILKRTPENKFSIFVMDEIFNSTNPVEGISGAYAIAKKISQYSNCLLVFTTHYIYLTKLKKTGRFVNYRMNIERNSENQIHYPYILEKGVSKQYIALDLLAKNGFDRDIIDEAITLKKKLSTTRV